MCEVDRGSESVTEGTSPETRRPYHQQVRELTAEGNGGSRDLKGGVSREQNHSHIPWSRGARGTVLVSNRLCGDHCNDRISCHK